MAGAGGCHDGAGAVLAAMGRMCALIETLLAELTVLPLGVLVAVQAGACRMERRTSKHSAAGTRAEHLEQESMWNTFHYQSSQVVLDALWPKHDPGLLRPSDAHPLAPHIHR